MHHKPGMYAGGQKLMQKDRIDAAQAMNVCSWPEKVAVSQGRCSPGQECMHIAQQARNDCRRPGKLQPGPGMYAAGQK